MKITKYRSLLFAPALGLGLVVMAALILVLLVQPPYLARAAGPTCGVAPGWGGDYTTIQAAVADPGCQTINVVGGTYNERLVITRSLTLRGGCLTTGCASRILRSSIINARGLGSVISISHGAAATIDGFTLTGGDGSANAYVAPQSGETDVGGGGIIIFGATAVIRDNLIENNVGSKSAQDKGGGGGGILVVNATAPVGIYGNIIRANVAHQVTLASPGDVSGCAGGGIAIADASAAVIAGNLIEANVSLRTNMPPQSAWAGGGGIAAWGNQSLTIDGNTVQNNVGNESGNGGGGGGGIGLFSASVATVTNNTLMGNTAVISGAGGEGGGLVKYEVLHILVSGNWVLNNTALLTSTAAAPTQDPWGAGGGMFLNGYSLAGDSATVKNNHFIGNQAAGMMVVVGTNKGHAEAGGLRISEISTTVVLDNEFRDNTAVNTYILNNNPADGWGGRPAGGGVYLDNNDLVTLSGNEIRNNVTARQQVVDDVGSGSEGGGLSLNGPLQAMVSHNTIAGNIAVISASITSDSGSYYGPGGGGAYLNCRERSCSVSFSGNQILSNTTVYTLALGGSDVDSGVRGGGVQASDYFSHLSFDGDTVSGNVALKFGLPDPTGRADGGGGGIALENCGLVTIGGSGCTIAGNTAAAMATQARGGGIRTRNTSLGLSGCSLKNNLALGQGQEGAGGGLWASNDESISQPSLTLADNQIDGNIALNTGTYGEGGGLRADEMAAITLSGNTIVNNVGAVSVTNSGGWGGGRGGGIVLDFGQTYTPVVVITRNVIAYNTAAVTVSVSGGVQVQASGGGAALDSIGPTTLSYNEIHHNVGTQFALVRGSGSLFYGDGGGLVLNRIPAATLEKNRIEANVALGNLALSDGASTNSGGGGGGLRLNEVTLLLRANVINGNTANLNGNGWGGGINTTGNSQVTMQANQILGNRMNPAYNGACGGVWAWESVLTSTNDIFARNYDAIGGGSTSRLLLTNDTLYNNGYTGARINDNGIMLVTNTIVYSHGTGLYTQGAAQLIGNYNLLSNTANYGGNASGSNSQLNKDPLFRNAGGDDFHLGSGSPALNAGTAAGAPSTDFEGNARPQGGGIDIGAYEGSATKAVYLPAIIED